MTISLFGASIVFYIFCANANNSITNCFKFSSLISYIFSIYLAFNLGVFDIGLIVGSFILIKSGIGKSTPTNNASPSPKIGRNDKALLLADEAAFSIAFLS